MKALKYLAHKENHKIGRNDPCFCGSGKKYKKCCLAANANEDSRSNESHTQQNLLQNLMNRAKTRHKDKECSIGTAEEMGLVKMSEIILEFAEDMIELGENDAARENSITLAIVAWNLAVLIESGEKNPLEHLNEFYRMMKIKKNSEEEEALTALVLVLIERKHVEYPHIHRFIDDFEIIETKNDFHLNVASIIMPPLKGVKKPLFSGYLK
jgi:hypothetical protein